MTMDNEMKLRDEFFRLVNNYGSGVFFQPHLEELWKLLGFEGEMQETIQVWQKEKYVDVIPYLSLDYDEDDMDFNAADMALEKQLEGCSYIKLKKKALRVVYGVTDNSKVSAIRITERGLRKSLLKTEFLTFQSMRSALEKKGGMKGFTDWLETESTLLSRRSCWASKAVAVLSRCMPVWSHAVEDIADEENRKLKAIQEQHKGSESKCRYSEIINLVQYGSIDFFKPGDTLQVFIWDIQGQYVRRSIIANMLQKITMAIEAVGSSQLIGNCSVKRIRVGLLSAEQNVASKYVGTVDNENGGFAKSFYTELQSRHLTGVIRDGRRSYKSQEEPHYELGYLFTVKEVNPLQGFPIRF